jgi:hypothetical protein
MDDQLLLGMWRFVLPIPTKIWKSMISGDVDLGFMNQDYHRVRNLVVEAMPQEAKPLTPEWISTKLSLPVPEVVAILEELEVNLTFLFRDPQGTVTWAYPVTVDQTPHQLSFSTGEQIYAA